MSAQGLSKQSKKKMITFAVIAVAVIVAIIILNVLTERIGTCRPHVPVFCCFDRLYILHI